MLHQSAKTGTFVVPATPVATTIVLGYKPSYVMAFSISNLAKYEHFNGMADDSSYDTFSHVDAQIVLNEAAAITLTANGFTLGLDICDTATDVIYWLAIR